MAFFLGLILEIGVALILALAYFFMARKVKRAGRLDKFITFFLVFGAAWGVIAMAQDRQALELTQLVYWLQLAFFAVQLLSAVVFLKNKKLGAVLLILGFLAEIPILHGIHYEYAAQTLFSFRVDLSSIKPYDMELGSYMFYISMPGYQMNEDPGWGVNLAPLVFIGYYLRTLKNTKHPETVTERNNEQE